MSDNDGKVSVSVAGDWGKPANTLIDRVSEALGGIFKPNQIRRIAKAEADARFISAQGDQRVADLQGSANEQPQLQERTMRRIVASEVRKQINVENVLAIAAEKLAEINDLKNSGQANQTSAEGISDDFIHDFFDYASRVSDQELQEIWASLLSYEGFQPGSISRQTLRILSDLGPKDAQLFTLFCSSTWTIIDRQVPVIDDAVSEILRSRGLSFDDLQHLKALGLVDFVALSSYSLSLNVTSDDPSTPARATYVTASYFGNNHQLVRTMNDDEQIKISTGQYSFTHAGKEILKVVKPRKVLSIEEAALRYFRKEDGFRET